MVHDSHIIVITLVYSNLKKKIKFKLKRYSNSKTGNFFYCFAQPSELKFY